MSGQRGVPSRVYSMLLDIGQVNTKIQSSSPDEEVEEFKKSRHLMIIN